MTSFSPKPDNKLQCHNGEGEWQQWKDPNADRPGSGMISVVYRNRKAYRQVQVGRQAGSGGLKAKTKRDQATLQLW